MSKVKFYLRRHPVNQQGYDSFGAYWGVGSPLYRYESIDGKHSGFTRATDRAEAKAKLIEKYPFAEFFR